MTEEHPRTGAARAAPPPRPVRAPAAAAEPDDSTPLGRAGRAVADAVGGLLGTSGKGATPPRADDARSGSAGLKDVLGAVAGAAAAWRERREAGAPPTTAPPTPAPPTTAPPTTASQNGDDAGQRSPSAFLSDLLAAAAPRLPIRDAARLRAAYPGATDEEIADALVARAARLSAGVGAAIGGLSAAQWLA